MYIGPCTLVSQGYSDHIYTGEVGGWPSKLWAAATDNIRGNNGHKGQRGGLRLHGRKKKTLQKRGAALGQVIGEAAETLPVGVLRLSQAKPSPPRPGAGHSPALCGRGSTGPLEARSNQRPCDAVLSRRGQIVNIYI